MSAFPPPPTYGPRVARPLSTEYKLGFAVPQSGVPAPSRNRLTLCWVYFAWRLGKTTWIQRYSQFHYTYRR